MPIFRGGVTPQTAAEREAAALGWSYVVLRTEEVLRSLRIENEAMHLRLSDITVPGQEKLFYESTDESARSETLMSHQIEREVYGRRWQIELDANSLFIQRLHQHVCKPQGREDKDQGIDPDRYWNENQKGGSKQSA